VYAAGSSMRVPHMPPQGMSFRDRTVLITGASSGIGRETALAFAAAGANVVLLARRAKVLGRVAAEARKLGAATLVASTDVTDAAAVTAAFRKAVKRFGAVDIVVNNAGVLIASKVEDLRDADLQKMLDVNLIGALHVMQSAVQVMRKQGRGHVVNVGSLAGRRGFSPLGGYCASKFALVGLTEALRTELVGERIHVSLVLPGVIDTPMAAQIQENPDTAEFWPEALNMPPSWVVWSIFLAIRFRLAEIAVPPGTALVEKLAALAPGTTDTLLRRATDVARQLRRRANA
ncbi:MAG: SDR family NAD(P)-dependent oxidoreductase, partial [Gemmatimonadota bacterium]